MSFSNRKKPRTSPGVEKISKGLQVEQLRIVVDGMANAGQIVGEVLPQRLPAKVQAAYAIRMYRFFIAALLPYPSREFGRSTVNSA